MNCGFARIEITPPFATALFGYPGVVRVYEPHKDRILDPLQASVVFLRDDRGEGLLLVSLDLCILLNADAEALRAALAQRLGLPRGRVLVACTHTHSAPLARFAPETEADRIGGGFLVDSAENGLRYGEWVLARLLATAARAVARAVPATVALRETLTGLGYDRRCRTAEGIRNCWNLQEFPDRMPAPAREARHSVIRIDFTGKPGGVLLQSAAVHPVVMGKQSNLPSADWPGHARRHIEKRLKDYRTVFFQGAAAQVQPWISTQGDPRALRWTGEALGAEALLLALNAAPAGAGAEALDPQAVALPGTPPGVTLFNLCGVTVVALPFELSANWAARIARTVERPVFFICLCNGWSGYWMSPEEFAEGGYEADVARGLGIGPDHSRALLEALARKLATCTGD